MSDRVGSAAAQDQDDTFAPADRTQPSADVRSPFSFPAFRGLWMANLVAGVGTLVQSVGASWMMTASGASAQMVALVQAASSLPIVLLALPSGAIADNRDRRTLLIVAQSILVAVSTSLALLTFLGVVTPVLLLLFTFLMGCGTALNGPAWQASVSDMVPRAVLPKAVAVNAMAMNIARSGGPALGGAIVALAGGPVAFLFNALSSMVLIVVLVRWRPIAPARPLPPERLGDAMSAGVRFVAMSPHIRVVLLRAIIFAFSASAIPALMPLVVRDLLGGGPFSLGLALGGFGLGAVIGAFAITPLRQSLSPEAIVRASTVLTAVALCGTASSRSLALTLPALVLAGIGWLLAFATINVSIQLASPRWVVARTLSLYQTAIFGGMAAGSWASGAWADRVGASGALLAAALVAFCGLGISLLRPLAALNRDNLDPLDRWEMPATAIPIDHRSGPMVIAIEHRIAEGDIAEFLRLMTERRRIRLRDGARHWALLRDVSDAQLWVERYDVPTWLEYVRHVSRRTLADDANNEALRALRIGGDPVVRRMVDQQAFLSHAGSNTASFLDQAV